MDDKQVAVLESDVDIKPPPMYKVVLHNDDFTPMDFVVEVLIYLFGHGENIANDIMMDVHEKGKASAGLYTRDIAETKAMPVTRAGQENEFPLLATFEEE